MQKASKQTKPKRKSKQKKRTFISHGRAYIQATYNNTIVSIADQQGNIIAWSSAGHKGFKGPKKATPYAASTIVADVAEKGKAVGIKTVDVFVKGVGSGRESAIRAFNANNITVVGIKDVTPIPHNGCRAPKVRRV
ncbi:MAG: 30S ribosomal protein S11 [Patescibacteria group bacterium]